jgi:hypothetical protein
MSKNKNLKIDSGKKAKIIDAFFSNHGFNELELLITYDQDIIKFFKTIKGSRYDGERKLWLFPLNQYQEIKNELESRGVVVSNELSEDELKVNDGVSLIESYNKTYLISFSFNRVVFNIVKKIGAKCSNNGWSIDVSEMDELIDQFKQHDVKYRFIDLDDISELTFTILIQNGDRDLIKANKYSRRVYQILKSFDALYVSNGVFEIPTNQYSLIVAELIKNGAKREKIAIE